MVKHTQQIIVGTPPPLLKEGGGGRGGRTFQKLSHLGGTTPEKGGCCGNVGLPHFSLLYSSIAFTLSLCVCVCVCVCVGVWVCGCAWVCVGVGEKVKVCLLHFDSSVF